MFLYSVVVNPRGGKTRDVPLSPASAFVVDDVVLLNEREATAASTDGSMTGTSHVLVLIVILTLFVGTAFSLVAARAHKTSHGAGGRTHASHSRVMIRVMSVF